MHLHVFRIAQLAKEFDSLLRGQRLIDCFSVSLDDIYFQFEKTTIRCQFYKGELFYQLPDQEKLQKRNRLPVFTIFIGKQLKSIEAIYLDRAFCFSFDDGGGKLCFYNYGSFASIAAYKEGRLSSQFPPKSKPSTDLATGKAAFANVSNAQELRSSYGFVSKEEASSFTYPLTEEAWKEFIELKSMVLPVFIQKNEKGYHLSDHEQNAVAEYAELLGACHDFTALYIASDLFHTSQNSLLKGVRQALKKARRKTAALEQKLANPVTQNYKLKADLLMANLHTLSMGMTEVVLSGFDGSTRFKIKLNAKLTPQANAERYYKKSKSEYKNVENLQRLYAQSETEVVQLEEKMEAINMASNYRELKKFMKQEKKLKEVKRLPYKIFKIGNLEVRVGKSAKDNDELIRSYASANDLWLHAKGVSGSHVVVRNGGSSLPEKQLEAIASIAAFYSKAKNEGLVAVIYTERKYIRKPKGGAPGAVKVDKEKVVLVEPKLPS